MSRMRLGISGQALGGVMNFHDIVRMGKKYGVMDYEIWPMNAIGEGEGYDRRNVEEIRRIADGEGVYIACVTLGAAFSEPAVNDVNGYVKDLCSTIEAAKRLGAPCINHYCYHICLGEQDYAKMERYWCEPLKLARELGVIMALENEAHDATATPEQMLRILQHFNDPFFKTNFDPTNYFHASSEGYPAGYDLLKDYIGYVHLKNGCIHRSGMLAQNTGAPMSGIHAPTPIQYTPIPDGSVNIAGLVSRLLEDGYQGVCTLEPHTQPDYVEAFYARESSYLRSLGFFTI